MLFEKITMVDETMQIREGMYLGTEGDRITYLSDTPPEHRARFGAVYPKSAGKLFLPGFFNAHSHAPMHLLRGYAENLSLMQWLNDRIFPFEHQLTADDIYFSCLLNIAEMLRFGIVSTTDMYMAGDALGRAFSDGGVKANFSIGCTCPNTQGFLETSEYQETRMILNSFSGYDNDRLKPEFSLHAEYTNSELVTTTLAETAKKENSAIHVHVSETAGEVAACRERHGGKSPVQYLADCGIFDVPATAAHCVHLDDDDIAILKGKNVSVATCPKSNLKLASGVCPAGKLLKAGVNVALGTDSVSSNNNLNLLEEMKFFALIHKGITGDPTVITPAETLYAATRAGALSQRRFNCGFLKEGFKADIIAVDVDRLYMKPVHNLLNNLIYSACGSDVCLTMVDGRVLYDHGVFPTLDLEKLIFETEKSCARIKAALRVND